MSPHCQQRLAARGRKWAGRAGGHRQPLHLPPLLFRSSKATCLWNKLDLLGIHRKQFRFLRSAPLETCYNDLILILDDIGSFSSLLGNKQGKIKSYHHHHHILNSLLFLGINKSHPVSYQNFKCQFIKNVSSPPAWKSEREWGPSPCQFCLTQYLLPTSAAALL